MLGCTHCVWDELLLRVTECLVVDDDPLPPPVVCQTDGVGAVGPLRALASRSLGQMLSVRKQQVVCRERLPPNVCFFTAGLLGVVWLMSIFFCLIWSHLWFSHLLRSFFLLCITIPTICFVQHFQDILAITLVLQQFILC